MLFCGVSNSKSTALTYQLCLQLLPQYLSLGHGRLLPVHCWLVGGVNAHHAPHPWRQHTTVGRATLNQFSQWHAYWPVGCIQARATCKRKRNRQSSHSFCCTSQLQNDCSSLYLDMTGKRRKCRGLHRTISQKRFPKRCNKYVWLSCAPTCWKRLILGIETHWRLPICQP